MRKKFGSDVMHSCITGEAKLLYTWGGEGMQYLIWVLEVSTSKSHNQDTHHSLICDLCTDQ